MDLNRAYAPKAEDIKKKDWCLIDADGLILGRLATRVANILRGKNKPSFTAHADCGDYVVIINADKIALTGKKWTDKEYSRYTGWIGGLRITTPRQMQQKHPHKMIELAVRGMLPKNKLNREILGKLKIYPGSEHPHKAQLGAQATK